MFVGRLDVFVGHFDVFVGHVNVFVGWIDVFVLRVDVFVVDLDVSVGWMDGDNMPDGHVSAPDEHVGVLDRDDWGHGVCDLWTAQRVPRPGIGLPRNAVLVKSALLQIVRVS